MHRALHIFWLCCSPAAAWWSLLGGWRFSDSLYSGPCSWSVADSQECCQDGTWSPHTLPGSHHESPWCTCLPLRGWQIVPGALWSHIRGLFWPLHLHQGAPLSATCERMYLEIFLCKVLVKGNLKWSSYNCVSICTLLALMRSYIIHIQMLKTDFLKISPRIMFFGWISSLNWLTLWLH